MRLRFFLAFALVVIVAVASVVLIARQGAASAVRSFMIRGSMVGIDEFAAELEDFYASNGSWQGLQRSGLWPGAGQGQGFGRGMQGMMQGAMMGQRLRLTDAQGVLVADTASPGMSDSAPGIQITRREMDSAVKLQVDSKVVGYLLAEGGMGFNRSDEVFLVNRISNAALIAGLIAGGLGLLLATLLSYRLLRPVGELTRAAENMASGDLSQRVPVRGDDELATLGVAFNQMADSLQHAEESRRAMTADIAHELRNPLAVQRANLEALQDGIYPLTPDSLAPILDQNQMLTRLVDDLRTLALADFGRLDLVRTPTDLSALVRRAIERYTPQAAARDIKIAPQISENLRNLSLDTQRIEQILNNLLDNALRHTPDGGKIEVSLSTLTQQVALDVHDSGTGIPEDALPYIFERFYRADRSRSRAEGGTGLGLAIARQLAEAHGGSLSAANHPQGGAVFTLLLPIST